MSKNSRRVRNPILFLGIDLLEYKIDVSARSLGQRDIRELKIGYDKIQHVLEISKILYAHVVDCVMSLAFLKIQLRIAISLTLVDLRSVAMGSLRRAAGSGVCIVIMLRDAVCVGQHQPPTTK